MPTKLASFSEATIRWWLSSWAMVAGIRQAGASTFTLASPVKGKYTPVKPSRLCRREQTMGLARPVSAARQGNSALMFSYRVSAARNQPSVSF